MSSLSATPKQKGGDIPHTIDTNPYMHRGRHITNPGGEEEPLYRSDSDDEYGLFLTRAAAAGKIGFNSGSVLTRAALGDMESSELNSSKRSMPMDNKTKRNRMAPGETGNPSAHTTRSNVDRDPRSRGGNRMGLFTPTREEEMYKLRRYMYPIAETSGPQGSSSGNRTGFLRPTSKEQINRMRTTYGDRGSNAETSGPQASRSVYETSLPRPTSKEEMRRLQDHTNDDSTRRGFNAETSGPSASSKDFRRSRHQEENGHMEYIYRESTNKPIERDIDQRMGKLSFNSRAPERW